MTLLILASIPAVLLVALYSILHAAPMGWQDRNGFHRGLKR